MDDIIRELKKQNSKIDIKTVRWFIKKCEELGIDWQNFDIVSMDWENKDEIKRQLEQILKAHGCVDKNELKYEEEKAKHEYRTYLEEIERKELEQLINEIKQITKEKSNLDKYYKKLYYLIDTLLESDLYGIIVYGDAGTGKTFNVIKHLERKGLEFEKDYTLIKGHITAKALYETLYKYNGKIIILDDIYSIFKNDICKAILLSALWDINNVRYVKYISTKHDSIPSQFELDKNTKMIFINNEIPDEFKAFLDRLLLCEVYFDYKTKIRMLKEYAKLKGYDDDIIDFIVEHTKDNTFELSFRTVDKIHAIKKKFNKGWEEIAMSQLIRISEDEDIELVKELMKKYDNVGDMIREFTKITGKSRRTFYNIRRKLLEREGKYRKYARLT